MKFFVSAPYEIEDLWVQNEMWKDENDTEYCKELWVELILYWDIGRIIPMYRKGDLVACYEIINSYYSQGTSSYSDWGGADGRHRDFEFRFIAEIDELKDRYSLYGGEHHKSWEELKNNK